MFFGLLAAPRSYVFGLARNNEEFPVVGKAGVFSSINIDIGIRGITDGTTVDTTFTSPCHHASRELFDCSPHKR